MPELIRVFRKELVVSPEYLDNQNHVNNVCYVSWMQDIAIEHSRVTGWGPERYLAMGLGWFVRRHTINYLHPILAGDDIYMETWISEIKHVSCTRCCRFIRKSDGLELANSESKWGMVNLATGAPTRVPQELHDCISACMRLP